MSYFVIRDAYPAAKKSAKKGPERYLIFELNQVLVILRCDDGRSAGHENVCRWFSFQGTYADFFLNRYK